MEELIWNLADSAHLKVLCSFMERTTERHDVHLHEYCHHVKMSLVVMKDVCCHLLAPPSDRQLEKKHNLILVHVLT